MSRPVVVLGAASAFALEVADVAEQSGFQVAALVENLDRTRCGAPVEGHPVLWIDDLAGLAGTHAAVCGLGTTKRRRFTDQVEALGMPFETVVHPRATVSPRSEVGTGSVVSVGAIVAAHSRVGRHVLLNRGRASATTPSSSPSRPSGPACRWQDRASSVKVRGWGSARSSSRRSASASARSSPRAPW
ncbi:MAG: hypothetical protein M5U14_05605 [Acidimicrobiia bacterium]|nr:hypothetical protein [Acidimicrobiia bacterium]